MSHSEGGSRRRSAFGEDDNEDGEGPTSGTSAPLKKEKKRLLSVLRTREWFTFFACLDAPSPSRPVIVELIYPQPSKRLRIRLAKKKMQLQGDENKARGPADNDKNANANLERHH